MIDKQSCNCLTIEACQHGGFLIRSSMAGAPLYAGTLDECLGYIEGTMRPRNQAIDQKQLFGDYMRESDANGGNHLSE